MSRTHRLLIVILLVALAGCHRATKPSAPAQVIVKPEPVVIIKRMYVPIPAALTKEEPIAEGPIAQCFEVAAKRRAGQERANARLRKIGAIQGTEVQP